jgi:hypothetical protein
MRVIFAGQAGTGKERAIQRIAEYARTKRHVLESNRTEHSAYILPIEFEAEIKRRHGSLTTVLDSFNDQLRAALWHETFSAINGRIARASPENVFLSIHLSLYRHSNFFTFTDWEELRRFQPDAIITIIDDIHEIWARIRRTTEQARDRTLLTLKELFAWRSVECFFAEQLSRNLFEGRRVPHFIVAVKHPLAMFDGLIFESARPRIYASYPITKTRSSSDAVAEINIARKRLHAEFVVFDPVTIDERILQFKVEGALPEQRTIEIGSNDRWPLDINDCALDEADRGPLYPLQLPTNEIEALGTRFEERWRWQDIDDNIRWRDLALINQSQGVFAYRPRFGNSEPSPGVTRELNYALDVRVLPCHIYSPIKDGDFSNSPFSPSAVVNTTNFDDAVRELKRKLSKDGA